MPHPLDLDKTYNDELCLEYELLNDHKEQVRRSLEREVE